MESHDRSNSGTEVKREIDVTRSLMRDAIYYLNAMSVQDACDSRLYFFKLFFNS